MKISLAPALRWERYNPAVRTFICTAALFLFAVCSSASNSTQNVDRVIVLKKERTLQLMSHGKVLKTYKVALGGNPVGPKLQQGDHRTPEGTYVLDHRNVHSHYYKSIHISYPSAIDRAKAAKLHVLPGGDIFLHGLPNGYGAVGSAHRLRDWTDGCVAVTDEEIDEIWKLVADGTPIEMRP
jgi:murein L,D-transpeptidase YafK